MVLVALGLDLLAAFSLQGFATDHPPYHKSYNGFLPIQIQFNLIYSQNV